MDLTNVVSTLTLWVGAILAIAGGSFLIIYFYAMHKRHESEKAYEYNLTFLNIKIPSDNETETKVAETLFSNLWGFKKNYWQSMFSGQYRVSFEIVSKSNGIGFYVVVPDDIALLVEKQINAAYPTAEIDIVNPQEIWDRGAYTKVVELKLKGANYYPIKNHEDIKNDTISAITSAMSKLGEDEVLAVQYVIQPSSDNWRLEGRSFARGVKNAAANPEKKTNIDTAFLEGVEKKIAHPGFYVKIRLVSIAKDKFTAEGNVQNLISAFEEFSDVNYNRFVQNTWISQKKLVDDFIYRRMHVTEIAVPVTGLTIYSNTSVLNTVEMASIFHMPNKNVQTPNIIWLQARRAAAPTNLPTEGLYLGKSIFRGVEKPVYMKREDRARHFYIIGQTGTGKSVFMKWMALQDIINGEGVAIIDPHGTDITDLLPLIPKERMNDVIYFDAADVERPMGLNMLEADSEEEQHMIINSFIDLLYKLYDPNHQGIMGPLLERTIRNVMLTAMTDPDATMVDVMRILIDENYQKKFIERLDNPMVKKYWEEQAKTTQNRKGETMGYFTAKFDRLTTDKTMRNLLGQPKSAFRIPDIMENKKILLIDLAKGKLGEENSNFIGLLLVPRILSAALARQRFIGKKEFPHFYLYVDEFQNFATTSFATILSEARKYKLDLIVGHQFVSQLDEKIKEAIFGNVGTICSFRVGVDDAEYLENQFGPTFTKRDMINIPIFNSYMRLLVDGHPTAPFSMRIDTEKALIRPTEEEKARGQQIIEMSRQKYGRDAKEVEEFIFGRMGMYDEPELPPAMSAFSKSKLPF
jgi:hypothetical protein